MLCAVFIVELRPVRSYLLLIIYGLPINAREPWVLHDFFSIGSTWSQSGIWILIQKSETNVFGMLTQEWEVKLRFTIFYILEQFFFILIIKWRLSTEHFIYYTAKGPPIWRLTMSFIQQNFGSEILSRSTNALCIVRTFHILLGKTKVCNFDVAIVGNQNVFGFQIFVKNILGMKMMQSQKNIWCVKPSGIFFKPSYLWKVEEELTTWAIFKYEVKFAVALEGEVHFYNEWVSDIFL